MTRTVEDAKAATLAALVKLGVEQEKIDISYITEELLAMPVLKKDSATTGPGTPNQPPNYYGNHLVHETANQYSWVNGNPNSTSDLPQHKCGSGHRWQASFSQYNSGAGWECPGDNPPGGFQAWA